MPQNAAAPKAVQRSRAKLRIYAPTSRPAPPPRLAPLMIASSTPLTTPESVALPSRPTTREEMEGSATAHRHLLHPVELLLTQGSSSSFDVSAHSLRSGLDGQSFTQPRPKGSGGSDDVPRGARVLMSHTLSFPMRPTPPQLSEVTSFHRAWVAPTREVSLRRSKPLTRRLTTTTYTLTTTSASTVRAHPGTQQHDTKQEEVAEPSSALAETSLAEPMPTVAAGDGTGGAECPTSVSTETPVPRDASLKESRCGLQQPSELREPSLQVLGTATPPEAPALDSQNVLAPSSEEAVSACCAVDEEQPVKDATSVAISTSPQRLSNEPAPAASPPLLATAENADNIAPASRWLHEAPLQPEYAFKHQLPVLFSDLVHDLLVQQPQPATHIAHDVADTPREDVSAADEGHVGWWVRQWFHNRYTNRYTSPCTPTAAVPPQSREEAATMEQMELVRDVPGKAATRSMAGMGRRKTQSASHSIASAAASSSSARSSVHLSPSSVTSSSQRPFVPLTVDYAAADAAVDTVSISSSAVGVAAAPVAASQNASQPLPLHPSTRLSACSAHHTRREENEDTAPVRVNASISPSPPLMSHTPHKPRTSSIRGGSGGSIAAVPLPPPPRTTTGSADSKGSHTTTTSTALTRQVAPLPLSASLTAAMNASKSSTGSVGAAVQGDGRRNVTPAYAVVRLSSSMTPQEAACHHK